MLVTDRVPKNASTLATQAMVGTYLIKAVDTSGQESEAEAIITTTIGAVLGLNVVETINAAPDWSGTNDGTVALDGLLRLGGSDTVDDWADVDAVLNVDVGSAGLEASGIHTFAETIDLGAFFTSRLTGSIAAIGSDMFSNVDAWTNVDLIDNVDGGDPSKWAVQLQMRYTDDDPGGSPAWTNWKPLLVGDYTARAFQFRLNLSSYQDGSTPLVSNAVVTVDMPDRTDGGNDLTCPVEGLRVAYNPAFKAPPALGIAAQGMQYGDRYYVDPATKDETGFDIQFFDSSGTAIERTFDWVAKGYGVKAS